MLDLGLSLGDDRVPDQSRPENESEDPPKNNDAEKYQNDLCPERKG